MTNRINIVTTIEDTRAVVKKTSFESLALVGKLKKVILVDSYIVDANLTKAQLQQAAECLTNPLIEQSAINNVPSMSDFAWAVEIGYLPGVTDTVGITAKETIADRIGRPFENGEAVFTAVVYFLSGTITKQDAEIIANNLYNPLIQTARFYSFDDYSKHGLSQTSPKVELHHSPQTTLVDLDVSDNELIKIGVEGIPNADGSRRGPLALNLVEMKAIRDYFKKQHRKPTDVELESLAQTWSEHCKHTIFNDPLDDIKDGLFKSYIKKATEEIRSLKKSKGKHDFCVSVFKDNSGAIEFDEHFSITHKVETHNSPSALDPFGGAVTGIVGVNRDTLGFGLGAKPIANTYGFCFADPEIKQTLFRDKEKKQKMLSPKRILEGVVQGVNVGGNSSGIPTPLGCMYFDNRFAGKPLVFVGTIGLIPKKINGKLSHEKNAKPGDYIVMIGGRVGIDGIHGATFSSEDLSGKSPISSVQIGDPITQKKMSDALIFDARDKDLYTSITDNGAGGLSSSVGETAEQSNGCEVWLDKVPLKYPGLDPWQIWISESQERMTVSVPKNKWVSFKKVMDLHDVEATIIGTFTDTGRCVVKHNTNVVMDIDLEFLHNGRPKKNQISKQHNQTPPANNQLIKTPIDFAAHLEKKLSELSTASYEFISQQFDHTVQGTCVTRPLHGKGRVNADAAVIKPLANSQKGIVTSHALCPEYSDIDTYYMAGSAIDLAIRNAVAIGADPDYLAILDNFCWSSSDKPERLYELKQAVKACYDYATAFETPFISGKDSMFNDFKGYDENGNAVKISAPPTLFVSTIGVVPDVKKAVTIDFKLAGDVIYIVGDTNENPKKNIELYRQLYKVVQKDLITSAIAVGRGGVAVALAKSAIGGMTGIDVMYDNASLSTESQGRFVVSINPKNQKMFEETMKNCPHERIGKVTSSSLIKINNATLDINKALAAYKLTFERY